MKKKILIIGPGMEIGGVERSLLGLLNSIDYDKFEVDLFLLSHTGEFMPLIDKQAGLLSEDKKFSLISWPISALIRQKHWGMASIRLFSKFYGDLRAKVTKNETLNITICKNIVSKISRPLPRHYDVALGFFGPHYFLEEKVNADLKIGWVHTDYGNINEKPDVKYTLPMWSSLDYIACVSENVKESFDSVYSSLRNKTVVIENIMSSQFIKAQADMFEVENEMPKDGHIRVLSVGRFCVAKAFDEAVVSCSILVRKGYNIKWYLVGYGPDEGLIREKIKEYHMEEYMIILGKKDNPYPYMKACDIYVQPSRYEGKAVTVTEAQILNKPVLITRYATAMSQVKDGIDGYICDMGAIGVAEGLEYLINHTEVREYLIENTKKQKYNNAEEIEKIIQLWKKKKAVKR